MVVNRGELYKFTEDPIVYDTTRQRQEEAECDDIL